MTDLEDDPFGFTVLVDEKTVLFNCGWRAPIVSMVDFDGEYTEEFGDAAALVVRMPESFYTIYLDPEDEGEVQPIH